MKESVQLYISLLKEMEEIKRRSELVIEMVKEEIEKTKGPSSQKISVVDLLELPPIMRSIVLKISSYESVTLSDLKSAFKDHEDDLPSLLNSLRDKGLIEEFEEDGVKKFRVQEIRKEPKKLGVDIWKSLDERLTSE